MSPRTHTARHKAMDVSQNLISLEVSHEQLDAVRSALDRIEAALPGRMSLESGDRRGLMLMRPKSEAFARQTLRVLDQNPKTVPPSLDVAAAQADLAAYDRLRPVLERVQRLARQLDDTVVLLGSDVMDVALDGYSQIKLSGGALGLDELRRELGGRFAKQRRSTAKPAAEPA